METIDRIFQLIDTLGISVYEFTKKTGVSKSYYHKQKKNNGNIGSQILWKIAEAYPTLNLKWLTNGDLPMFLDENSILKMQAKNASLNESENASLNASLNESELYRTDTFPSDCSNGCKNCYKMEVKYLEAREYLLAKESENKELIAANAVLRHENGQLREELAKCNKRLKKPA